MAGEADWLCAGKKSNQSAGKNSEGDTQKKGMNAFAAWVEIFYLWCFKERKDSIKLELVKFPQFKSKSGHALVFCRLLFIHNVPRQLGQNTSLVFYFYGLSRINWALSSHITQPLIKEFSASAV